MDRLIINFHTLTPLWTGDAQRRSDRLRETGLLGSLRWWYEGLVRGWGRVACDPSAGDCVFDGEAYEKALALGGDMVAAASWAGLCPVCRLFGATGWRRRFRLEVFGLQSHPLFFMASPQIYSAAGNWLWRMFGGQDTGGTKTGRGPDTRFTFGSGVLWADPAAPAELRTMALEPGDEDILKRLAFLLEIVSRYGGWGAKTQNGFGQIKILEGLPPHWVAEGRDLVRQEIERGEKAEVRRDDCQFTMSQFFSRTYELNAPEPYIQRLSSIGNPSLPLLRHYVPCAFDIRYKSRQRNPFSGLGQDYGLRPYFRKRFGAEVAERFFGGTDQGGRRTAGRIRVSHLYKEEDNGRWRLKIWGDVPPGIWDGLDEVPKMADIKQAVDEFIAGPQGMFPGSRWLAEYEFNPEEFFA